MISNNQILTCVDSHEPCNPLLSIETPNYVQSVAYNSQNNQATSKCSDQTARMSRLVGAFAGHTYYFVGNLMLRLI